MNSFLKRLTDLLSSALGLIVFSPFFLLIAILIRLSSSGPAFFKQTRVGLHGKTFNILKFRTMNVNAEKSGPLITVDKDNRITKIGKFLRKSKLDELPQLINVLKGEMSLVGPRPEVPYYVAMYTESQRKILNYKPGITDPASIKFRNESALLKQAVDSEALYVQQIMPVKLKKNLAYQARASWLSDIGVIVKTIVALFRS